MVIIAIDDVSLQYDINNKKHHQMSMNVILNGVVPNNTEEMIKLFANQYLSNKGINIDIDEILEKHYPESLI